MFDFLAYEFMQRALLGGVAIGLLCGMVGPFLVLRRLSLLGDGLAHLAFGGVALGLLLGVDPRLAAIITVVLGSFWVSSLIKKNVHGDAAIALLLSLGVGMGIVIIGIVRGFNTSLFSYLIGSILTLNQADILLSFGLLGGAILFLVLFYKDMFALTFNEELAQLSQKNVEWARILFTILIALVVVVSIRAVGILLVSALLVIPTLIALNLAKSFKQTILFSTIFALGAIVVGTIVSFIMDIPPSGSIVLLLFGVFAVTQVFRK